MLFSLAFLFLLLPCPSLQTTAREKKPQAGSLHPSPLVNPNPSKTQTIAQNAKLTKKDPPFSANATQDLKHTNQSTSSSGKPSHGSSQRTPKMEARPSSSQHPIKVLISDACIHKDPDKVTANSTQVQSREVDLKRGSPLVLTHQINLVPGSCGGCEAEFATLRERLERLESEVLALRKQCGSAEGAACPLRSDDNECPNDCSDQGRCEVGKCICFPGYSGPDCGSATCPLDCNNNGKCVNGQCVCESGFSGPDCTNKTCPVNCNNKGQCVKGRCICRPGFIGPDCSTVLSRIPQFRSTNITDSSITLSWSLPSIQYSTYHITFKSQKEGDDKTTTKVGGRLSSFTQTGLAAGQKYKVSIRGEKAGKMGPESIAEFTTLISSPKNLHIVKATRTSVLVQWESPMGDFDRYQLTISPNQTDGQKKESQETTLPSDIYAARIDGLEEGHLYDITLVALKGKTSSQPIRVQAIPGNAKKIFTKVTVETVTAKVPTEGDVMKGKKTPDKTKLDKTLFIKKNEEGQKKGLAEHGSKRDGDVSKTRQGTHVKTDVTKLNLKDKTEVGSKTVTLNKSNAGPGTKTTLEEKSVGQTLVKQPGTRKEQERTKVTTQPESRHSSKQHPKVHSKPDLTALATGTAKQVQMNRTHTKTDRLKDERLQPNGTQSSSSLKKPKSASKQLTHSVKDVSSNRTVSVKVVLEQTTMAEKNATKISGKQSTKHAVGSGKANGTKVENALDLATKSTVFKDNTKSRTTKPGSTKLDRTSELKTSILHKNIKVGDNQTTSVKKVGVTQAQANRTERIPGSLGNVTVQNTRVGSGKVRSGNGTDQINAVKQRGDSNKNVTISGTLRTAEAIKTGPAGGTKKGVFRPGGAVKTNNTASGKEREKEQGRTQGDREVAVKRTEISTKQVSQKGSIAKTVFSQRRTIVQTTQGVAEDRGTGAGGSYMLTVRNDTSTIRQSNQGNYSTFQAGIKTQTNPSAQVNRNDTSGSKIRHVHVKLGRNDSSSQTGLDVTIRPATHSKNNTEVGGGGSSSKRNIYASSGPSSQTNRTSSSTRKTESTLHSVEVQNITSRGFVLIWEVPQGMFQNFVVTTREYLVEGGEEEEEEEEIEEEEEKEEETSEVGEIVSQEGGDKGDNNLSIAGKNITDGHRTSSKGISKTQPPTKSHNVTSVRVGHKSVKKLSQVVSGTTRSLPFRNLRPQTRYSLSLYGMGPGQRSKIHHLIVSTGPEAPSELLFSNVTDSSLSVSWTKPKNTVTNFRVTYTHTENGQSMSVLVDSKHSSVTLSQLSPGSSYEVSVISVLGLEESDPITGLVITVPDPPTDLRVVNVTDNKALLRWRPALATVDRYIIVYGSENVPEITIKVSGNAAEQQLRGLMSGTVYNVTVTSQLDSQQSAGATTTFTTAGGGGSRGEGPQELTVSQVTARSVVLSWKSPRTAVTGYKLTYHRAGQEKKEVILTSAVTKYKLTGLHPLSKYTVRVQGERRGQYTTAISFEFTTGSLRFPFPTDCSQQLLNGMQRSGEAEIFPSGKHGRPMRVYCDMETDGGGWTVFQRRMNGEASFFRGWSDYSYGFGNLSGEFWLGNEQLHNLTSLRPMALRVDLHAGTESAYAHYSSFYVEDYRKHYVVKLTGYTGTAGDSMKYHNGRPFSTYDRDHRSSITRCARSYRGGWWYKNCHEANLNGLYGSNTNHQGVIWTDWKGKDFSIPFTEMKLRPTYFTPQAQG